MQETNFNFIVSLNITHMKKYLFLSSVMILLLTVGCNEKKIARLQSQQDSLVAVSKEKEASLGDFVAAFNEIQANLDSIKNKEMVIDKSAKFGEVKGSRKAQIQSDIAYIYSLQVKNRKLVADLTARLNKSNRHSAELQKMVDNLNKSISEKDSQIASLTEELGKVHNQAKELDQKVASLGSTIDSLGTETARRTQIIEEQTAELNTAYYVIGTNKELKSKKIITPIGGFIGIGRTKELTPDVDMSRFTKIDITESKEIPIMKKKFTLVTSHPKSSYKIEGEKNSDTLVIVNPDEFWSMSKALVILTR
jgi:hypothetical protein